MDGKGVRVIGMNREVSFIKNSWGDDDKDPDRGKCNKTLQYLKF